MLHLYSVYTRFARCITPIFMIRFCTISFTFISKMHKQCFPFILYSLQAPLRLQDADLPLKWIHTAYAILIHATACETLCCSQVCTMPMCAFLNDNLRFRNCAKVHICIKILCVLECEKTCGLRFRKPPNRPTVCLGSPRTFTPNNTSRHLDLFSHFRTAHPRERRRD